MEKKNRSTITVCFHQNDPLGIRIMSSYQGSTSWPRSGARRYADDAEDVETHPLVDNTPLSRLKNQCYVHRGLLIVGVLAVVGLTVAVGVLGSAVQHGTPVDGSDTQQTDDGGDDWETVTTTCQGLAEEDSGYRTEYVTDIRLTCNDTRIYRDLQDAHRKTGAAWAGIATLIGSAPNAAATLQLHTQMLNTVKAWIDVRMPCPKPDGDRCLPLASTITLQSSMDKALQEWSDHLAQSMHMTQAVTQDMRHAMTQHSVAWNALVDRACAGLDTMEAVSDVINTASAFGVLLDS
jgi:hypothetical protein